MANFFEDNRDIQFYLNYPLLKEIVLLREGDFSQSKDYPYAPENMDDALDNYRRVLSLLGGICGDFVAPRAEAVDQEGPHYCDGKVDYPKGICESIEVFAKADLMGFTLPRRYGGLNMPVSMYCAAIEMVSRADAALMTLVGLQDIAETINSFADETIKAEYLPRFARGSVTGAMVLTEPDAGSDLQAVQTRGITATPVAPLSTPGEGPGVRESGLWHINGVKRFITNGCGDILLVLARSEPGTTDGRGLSLFLVEQGEGVRVRRIENKMGIHGSPTCEIQFTNAPGKLIGRRKFGLIKYVMALMKGARLGIASQGLGIAEAAYREGLQYAREREQFGKPIIQFPAVYEMLLRMKMNIEAARALIYYTSMIVDMDEGLERVGAHGVRPELKAQQRQWDKLAATLTPMAKYYASELSIKATYDAQQIHAGSGYMKEYPVERLYRDARITTIYEGTTQLQVVAAVGGVLAGNLNPKFGEWKAKAWPATLQPLAGKLAAAQASLAECIEYLKGKDKEYIDLIARRLVDVAMETFIGYLLLEQAEMSESKLPVARMFITDLMPRLEMNAKYVTSGDMSMIEEKDKVLAV